MPTLQFPLTLSSPPDEVAMIWSLKPSNITIQLLVHVQQTERKITVNPSVQDAD